jgi:hypothetical protein
MKSIRNILILIAFMILQTVNDVQAQNAPRF